MLSIIFSFKVCSFPSAIGLLEDDNISQAKSTLSERALFDSNADAFLE